MKKAADFTDSVNTETFLHFPHAQTRATIYEIPQNNIAAANFLEDNSTSPTPSSERFLNSPTPLPQLLRSPRKHNDKTNMQKVEFLDFILLLKT